MTDAGRTCELCGQPVEVVTADEGTQSYRGVAAQRAIDELLTEERVATGIWHWFFDQFGGDLLVGLGLNEEESLKKLAAALIEELRR